MTPSDSTPENKFPFLRPAELPDELGRLGPYRVLALLGQGGMGEVFRAEDPQLKRQVALKVMKPDQAANPQAKARFFREAEAQARVEHDHIIPIFQIGEDQGTPFIAMPLLKGQTLLATMQTERGMSQAEVIRIGREVALGLAAAHEHGLIHRDIKPANIWLEGTYRRVKILDFGLARLNSVEPLRPDSSTVEEGIAPRTASGVILGTPQYMAPEQALSEPVDHRADLFSLGVVLYELATGHQPFRRENMFATLDALVREEPKHPRLLNSSISPTLALLILQLLEKSPEKRVANAALVAEILGQLQKNPLAVVSELAPAQANESAYEETVLLAEPRPVERNSPRLGLTLLTLFGVLIALVSIALILLLKSGDSPQTTNPTATSPSQPTTLATSPATSLVEPLPATTSAAVTGVDPLAVAFEEVHGVNSTELKIWYDKLPKHFRPTVINIRGGSQEVLYDAVAHCDPSGDPHKLLLDLPRTDGGIYWKQLQDEKYQYHLEFGKDQQYGMLWSKPFRGYFVFTGSATQMMSHARISRDIGNDWPVNFYAYGPSYRMLTQPGAAGSLDWQELASVRPADFPALQDRYSKQNWRIQTLAANTAKDEMRLQVVFAENKPYYPTEYKHRLTPLEYKAAIQSARQRGYRLHTVTSIQEPQGVFYYASFDRVTQKLSLTQSAMEAIRHFRELNTQMYIVHNGVDKLISKNPNFPLPTGIFKLSYLNCSNVRNFSDKTVEQFQHLPTIHDSLYLINSNMTDEKLSKILTSPSVANIAVLDLKSSLITDDSLITVGQLPRLCMLSLQGTAVSSAGLAHLKPLRLRGLSLFQCEQINNASLDHLVDKTTLNELNLLDTQVNSKGVAKLARLLNLRTLQLSGPNITDEATFTISKLIKLTFLELPRTAITDEGFKQLRKLPELEKLVLYGGTAITPEGMLLFKDFRSLRQLSLTSCRSITDDHLIGLHEAKNLRELWLINCNVTLAAVQTLARSLPKCRIHSSYKVFEPTETDKK